MVRSVKTPVAVNDWERPFAIEEGDGSTTIDVRVAALTVTVPVPWTPSRVAVMVVLPILIPVTTPWVGAALLTCTVVLSAEVQPT